MNRAAAAAAAVVVGIGAATTGAFAWTGSTALEQLRTQSAELAKLSPSFKVVDEKVERGLFHSSYEVKLRIGCVPPLPEVPGAPPLPVKPGEPIEVGMRTDVRHGPLLPTGTGFAQLDTTLIVPESWQARVDALTDKQPPLHVRTTVGFDRSFASELSVPAFKFSDPQAGSFETTPFQADIKGSNAEAVNGGDYEWSVPGWAFHTRAPDARLDVTVGRMDGHTKLGARKDPALWLVDSETNGSITDLTFVGSTASSLGGSPTTFKTGFPAFTLKGTSKLDKGLYASEFSYTGRGTVNDVTIDKIELKGGLRRLDAAGYQALIKHIFESALSCDAKAGSLEAAFPGFEREAVGLMTHDPEYGLDMLAIELDGQRAELSYAVGTKGVTAADAQRALLDLAIEHGVLRAHVKLQLGLLDAIDKRLVAGTPNAQPGALRAMAEFGLAQFGEAGYVVQTGDTLESTLAYEQGVLLLNGKPPVLPDLGGLMGGGAP